MRANLKDVLAKKVRKTIKAVAKGENTKTAFAHYFGLDKKGNVNVDEF